MTTTPNFRKPLAVSLVAAALLAALPGCAPIVVGGAAVMTGVVATDRRSAGTQVDDQTIEVKAMNALPTALEGYGHVSATSYNRLVLLIGEVPKPQLAAAAQQAMLKIDGVRSVVNDIIVAPDAGVSQISADTLTTGKVKAAMIDAKGFPSGAVKVITERGIVYLLGIVTVAEAEQATEITRGVSGVQKVVKVFEVVTPAELQKLQPARGAPSTPPAN